MSRGASFASEPRAKKEGGKREKQRVQKKKTLSTFRDARHAERVEPQRKQLPGLRVEAVPSHFPQHARPVGRDHLGAREAHHSRRRRRRVSPPGAPRGRGRGRGRGNPPAVERRERQRALVVDEDDVADLAEGRQRQVRARRLLELLLNLHGRRRRGEQASLLRLLRPRAPGRDRRQRRRAARARHRARGEPGRRGEPLGTQLDADDPVGLRVDEHVVDDAEAAARGPGDDLGKASEEVKLSEF